MQLAFADQLEPSEGDGLEREAPDLGGAKARWRRSRWSLSSVVEQPERDRVNRKGGDEGVGDVLEWTT